MRKILPWIGGAVIGAIFCLVVIFIDGLSSVDIVRRDPTYDMVATSWGGPMNRPESRIYQMQVVTEDANDDGTLEVSARACRQGVFFYTIGQIGSASDMAEAIREFGDIVWHEETVTVGGVSGTRGTFKRKRIETHR
jgi:hypothetical protein